jgi:hypothetical protein
MLGSSKYKSIHFVTLPLTSTINGQEQVPFRSGLNWGQRENRNPNQAYIAIPISIRRSNFFPEQGVVFNIICDDGFEVSCVRAQQGGKALQSKPKNSILGQYFRNRLGLAHGDLVIALHLYEYGRTSVDIHKRDGMPYFLDFSSP